MGEQASERTHGQIHVARRRTTVAFRLLLLCATLPTPSARAEATSLGLREAVVLARTNHPDLAVLEARIAAQNRAMESARRSWFPTLTARALAGMDHDDRPVLTGTTTERLRASVAHVDGTATLDALIVDFGRRRHAIAAERALVLASEHALAEGERVVDLSVAELFVTVLAERSLVAEAERSLARQSELLRAVEALVEGKQRPRIDAQRLALEVDATRDAVKGARLLFERDRALLRSTLGLPPDQALDLQELDDRWFGEARSLAETLATTFSQRPTLKGVSALEHAAEERAVAARRATLPSLSAQANALVRRDAPQDDDQVAEGTRYALSGTVTLSWKLDLVAFNEARRSQADALVASRSVDAERRRLQDETVLSHYERERTEIALSQAQHILQAAEVTQLAQRRRYELGAASLLELIDAETLLSAAGVRVVQARLDFVLARVRVLASEGVLAQRIE